DAGEQAVEVVAVDGGLGGVEDADALEVAVAVELLDLLRGQRSRAAVGTGGEAEVARHPRQFVLPGDDLELRGGGHRHPPFAPALGPWGRGGALLAPPRTAPGPPPLARAGGFSDLCIVGPPRLAAPARPQLRRRLRRNGPRRRVAARGAAAALVAR